MFEHKHFCFEKKVTEKCQMFLIKLIKKLEQNISISYFFIFEKFNWIWAESYHTSIK